MSPFQGKQELRDKEKRSALFAPFHLLYYKLYFLFTFTLFYSSSLASSTPTHLFYYSKADISYVLPFHIQSDFFLRVQYWDFLSLPPPVTVLLSTIRTTTHLTIRDDKPLPPPPQTGRQFIQVHSSALLFA